MATAHMHSLIPCAFIWPCCGTTEHFMTYATTDTKQEPDSITLSFEPVETIDAVLERHRDICPQLWPGDDSLV